MFDFFFGWRKASKCKKMIKRVQCRIKLLKNKNNSIVRQLRQDLGHLLKIGYQDVAFHRAEQLYRDESISSVYELLDHFCDFIIIHLSYIRRHKDCPNDINEAVSTLIYASARCGDLPELRVIRDLFGQRYGQRYALTALDLLPGNLVNHQIKEKLTAKPVDEETKHRLLFEIFREHCLHSSMLALEHSSPLAQEYSFPLALEYSSEWHQNQHLQKEERLEDTGELDVKDIEIEAMYFDSSPKSMSEDCFSLMDVHEINTASASSKAVGATMHIVAYNAGNTERLLPQKSDVSVPSSSEDSSWISEKNVDFLDIEEFKSPKKKDGKLRDQRLFVFTHVEQYDSSTTTKTNRKRYRKKLLSREHVSSINDMNYDIYYTQNFLGRQRKPKGQPPYYAKKRAKTPSVDALRNSCSKSKNGCSIEFPCYYCTNDDKDQSVDQSSKENSRAADLDFPDKATGVNQKQKTEKELEKRLLSPYLRSITMPEKHVKEIETENIVRCISFPGPQGNQINHVHPKLPDYDDLAAKFIALKQEYQQKKHNQENKV